jgi:Flp pilus assembly protein TadB
MNEWVGFGLIAAGVSAVCLGAVALVTRRGRSTAGRLGGSADESVSELVLGDMTVPLAGQLGGGGRDREQILPELLRAGFYRPTALTEYQALRTAFILTPLVAAAAACQLVEPRQMPWVILGGLLLAAVGFSAPRVYVNLMARKRIAEIERGLPVFADLLSLALMAGQSLLAGLGRVSDQLRGTFPRMSEELDIVRKQSELLSLNLAFDQWAQRSQIPELKNLAAILNQTQRVGNDVTTVLLEFATNLRTTLRQRADAQAQRAGFWMIFPTILCLWIPAGVILVGPLFFEFGERRRANKEALQTTSGDDIKRGLKRSDPFQMTPVPKTSIQVGNGQ